MHISQAYLFPASLSVLLQQVKKGMVLPETSEPLKQGEKQILVWIAPKVKATTQGQQSLKVAVSGCVFSFSDWRLNAVAA